MKSKCLKVNSVLLLMLLFIGLIKTKLCALSKHKKRTIFVNLLIIELVWKYYLNYKD